MYKNEQEKGEIDKLKPFLEHLEDLRTTLLWSLAVIVIGMVLAIPLAPYIFQLLRQPLSSITENPDQFLRSIKITGGLSILMQTVFWSGLFFSAPFLVFFITKFAYPGLKPGERKYLLTGCILAFLLFFLGAGLAYYLTLPVALKVMLKLHSWLSISAEWTVNSYVSFAMQVLIAFGLAFELPIVIIVLGYLHIISSRFLRQKRRHAIVVILILAMVLTPGPDVFSQLIMACPMIVLYEVCIWIIAIFERKHKN
jgi:sec-independent protein translocase protein TatC